MLIVKKENGNDYNSIYHILHSFCKVGEREKKRKESVRVRERKKQNCETSSQSIFIRSIEQVDKFYSLPSFALGRVTSTTSINFYDPSLPNVLNKLIRRKK